MNKSTLTPHILEEVATYYSSKLETFGQTPEGVDWNGEESQNHRFDQLLKIVDPSKPFTLNDLGCGFGSMFEYINGQYKDFKYTGLDISSSMIEAAQERFGEHSHAEFIAACKPSAVANYTIASGIFNVRQDRKNDEWLDYILEMLDVINEYSMEGFSFNCLTKYSDAEYMRDYLYYADPCMIFDHCKIKYSRQVALLHDYGLYEFTILVRK